MVENGDRQLETKFTFSVVKSRTLEHRHKNPKVFTTGEQSQNVIGNKNPFVNDLSSFHEENPPQVEGFNAPLSAHNLKLIHFEI